MKKESLRSRLARRKEEKGVKTVAIRKKAAKPMTPDELAQRASLNKPKVNKGFDLSVLRTATGSTEPIHLFRAIRALSDSHIPTIIHLLQNESKIREHTKYKLMQPVYVIVDGNGAYVNDYYLAYVIDADETYVRCLNAEGTMVATFPKDSTSIHTTTEFKKFESDLKPASEKPVRANKTPIVGATDFEPPTINDAIDAQRIPKKRLAHSDLYTLFASFSEGSSLAAGTVAEGEPVKKKKKKAAPDTEAASATTEVEDQDSAAEVAPWEDQPKVKKKKKKKSKLKSKNRDKATAVDSSIDPARRKMLESLDLSGYETDPDDADSEPDVVAEQKAKKEVLEKFKKPSSAKVHMPLTPSSTKLKTAKQVEEVDEEVIESFTSGSVRDRLKSNMRKAQTQINKANKAKEKTTKKARSDGDSAPAKKPTKKVDVDVTMEESISALNILASVKSKRK